MDMHIAENLRRLRRSKDMTQEELAAYLGVSGQAVSKWETGSVLPPAFIVEKIDPPHP